jgi:hypothetical protein
MGTIELGQWQPDKRGAEDRRQPAEGTCPQADIPSAVIGKWILVPNVALERYLAWAGATPEMSDN